mgnify:CR=1 FL=1
MSKHDHKENVRAAAQLRASKTQLELIEGIYRAEIQIDDGHGLTHEEARNTVINGLKPLNRNTSS